MATSGNFRRDGPQAQFTALGLFASERLRRRHDLGLLVSMPTLP